MQVSPTEVEDVLLQHESIKEAAVAGVPDEEAGELTRAYIVLKEGYSLDEESINQLMRTRLAPYKQLHGGIKVIDKLPRNHLGKLSRKLLQNLAADGV